MALFVAPREPEGSCRGFASAARRVPPGILIVLVALFQFLSPVPHRPQNETLTKHELPGVRLAEQDWQALRKPLSSANVLLAGGDVSHEF